MYTIDKGIPIPSAKRQVSDLVSFLQSLANDDSFLVPGAKEMTRIRSASRTAKVTLKVRLQPDGQYRIWRCEPDKPLSAPKRMPIPS